MDCILLTEMAPLLGLKQIFLIYSVDKAQSLLERVKAAATEVALHINSSKTEYMAYNLRSTSGRPFCTLDGSIQFKKLRQVRRLLDRSNEKRPRDL